MWMEQKIFRLCLMRLQQCLVKIRNNSENNQNKQSRIAYGGPAFPGVLTRLFLPGGMKVSAH